jgi:hypothetical protein
LVEEHPRLASVGFALLLSSVLTGLVGLLMWSTLGIWPVAGLWVYLFLSSAYFTYVRIRALEGSGSTQADGGIRWKRFLGAIQAAAFAIVVIVHVHPVRIAGITVSAIAGIVLLGQEWLTTARRFQTPSQS